MTLLEDEIGHRRFNHRNLQYDFTYKEIQKPLLEHASVRRLYRYIQLIEQGKFPNALFDNPAVPRASMMKIRGLDKSQKNFLQSYVVEHRLVERVPAEKAEIPGLVQDVFKNFKEMSFQKIPDHAPVLKSILLRHPNSVAIELPVWKVNEVKTRCLTGHVDLVQVERKNDGKVEIKILDYKPEGENRFIFCLPQIALYAKMLRAKLLPEQSDEAPENVTMNCYIFDKKAMWKFQHDILEKLDDKLARYQVPREWAPFLN
nr:hypothetical protein [Candidatus Sigynarchaeota archaeon]